MGVIVEHDGSTVTNVFRGSSPDYQGQPNTLVNPDLNGLIVYNSNGTPKTPYELLVPTKYWKQMGGAIVEMTQPEKDALDVELAQQALLNTRARTKAFINTPNGKIVKALALVVLDEINALRSQHGLANRTAGQLLNAVNNKVDNGDTD